jgi:integration host factor subunit beta
MNNLILICLSPRRFKSGHKGKPQKKRRNVPPSQEETMLKSELVHRITNSNPHLYERDAAYIVDAILDEITNALSRGERVELRGFGAFMIKHRRARNGRNPKTGVKVSVGQKYAPFFRASKDIHKRLNRV